MKLMPVTAMFMRLSRACFAIGSLQVFPRPRQAVFGLSRGNVFRADPALVAEAVDEIEQRRKIDLSGSRLVPAGNVGDLHVPDPREVRRKGLGEIVSHGLHVKEVVLQFEIGGACLIDDRERLGRLVQIEAGNGLRVDGLDEERHAVEGKLARGVPEVRYISLAQLRSIDVPWRDTGETIHLLATERFGVLDCLRDAFAKFSDAIG